MTDGDPLLEQLTRVQSDLGFRKWTRHRIWFVVALVVLDLVVSIVSVTALVRSYQQADARERDQQEARRGSCVQFNVNQQNQREAIIGGLVDTFRPLVPAGQEQQLTDFANALRVNVERKLPYRHCDDAGIDAFLKNPPQDPATGG